MVGIRVSFFFFPLLSEAEETLMKTHTHTHKTSAVATATTPPAPSGHIESCCGGAEGVLHLLLLGWFSEVFCSVVNCLLHPNAVRGWTSAPALMRVKYFICAIIGN